MEYDDEVRRPRRRQGRRSSPRRSSATATSSSLPAYQGGPKLADGAGIAHGPHRGAASSSTSIYAEPRRPARRARARRRQQGRRPLRPARHRRRQPRRPGRRSSTRRSTGPLPGRRRPFGDGTEDLFGTVDELAGFTATLATNDQHGAPASTSRPGRRLGAARRRAGGARGALKNLAIALDEVVDVRARTTGPALEHATSTGSTGSTRTWSSSADALAEILTGAPGGAQQPR